jgi:hypothetical protein
MQPPESGKEESNKNGENFIENITMKSLIQLIYYKNFLKQNNNFKKNAPFPKPIIVASVQMGTLCMCIANSVMA